MSEASNSIPLAQQAFDFWKANPGVPVYVVNADLYDHVWFWRARLPERKGQRCRVVVRARRMNSVLVEFPDGFTVVTSRYAVRKAK